MCIKRDLIMMRNIYGGFVILFTFLFLTLTNLHAQNALVVPNIMREADVDKMNYWVDSVFNSLSMDERIGQLFIIVSTGDNTAANKKRLENILEDQHIGGLLFSKGTPANQLVLTNYAQSKAKVPLLVTLDGEWGLAMRLGNTTNFPRNMMLGAIQNDSLLFLYGQEVARQCRLMGIHVNFAPDMDVNSNPANPVIGTRSFGENPDRVAKAGIMYSKGLEAGGVMAVAKHFPGHGDTSTDSHHTLPLIEHNRQRLDSIELKPFDAYIRAGLSGMMIAHLRIPALDSIKQPSSLSHYIVTGLLHDRMGFSGLVFTDGLQMKGVANEDNYCVRALLAGNDVLLGPVNPVKDFKSVKKAVEEGLISKKAINEKCKKVLSYKYILNVSATKVMPIDGLVSKINTPYAEWLNGKLNERAMTLLKNDSAVVPLQKLDKRKIAAVSIGALSDNKFHSTLKLYDDVTCFSVADVAELTGLKNKLDKYNTVIVSVHNTKVAADAGIQTVCKGKDMILVFFTSPYRMSAYASAIKDAKGVVLAYENSNAAQDFAAQAIFGGNGMDGRIPVSIKGLFKEGEGIVTKKTRLSYNLPEEVGIVSNKLDRIEGIVDEGIKKKAYPGCQVLVAKDGVVIYNRSFGAFEYNGDEKVTDDAIYDLASMTKAVATVPAVMKLYDEKKLTLNAPLSNFVPALKGTDKAAITVRDALLHESRLPSFLAYYMAAIDTSSYKGRLFAYKESTTHTAQFDASTWARTDYKYKQDLVSSDEKDNFLPLADGLYVNKSYKDTIISSIANAKLRKRKSYLYSCLNFMLLKEAVEKVAQTDMNTFLQDNFYKKLGATTITFNPLKRFEKKRIAPTEKDDFLRKQLLRGYVHDEGAAFMGGISGNAGLFSDANDIAKLCQMFLNDGAYGGERFVSERTCKLFTQTTSSISRRGLGFDKPEPRTNKANPCSPSTPVGTYGHTGFTGTCFWVDPDNNLVYIFLSNRITPKRTHKELMSLSIRPRIQEAIYAAMRNVVEVKAAPVAEKDDETDSASSENE